MAASSKVLNLEQDDPENIFDFIQPLGHGAYASVYKALDKRNGELVAIKITPITEDYPYKEDQLLALKSHSQKCEHLLTIHEFFKKDGNIWISMELCIVTTLHIMKHTDETLSEKQIKSVLRATLKAMVYLHDNQLIHGDIKASNIFLDHKGIPKLGYIAFLFFLLCT